MVIDIKSRAPDWSNPRRLARLDVEFRVELAHALDSSLPEEVEFLLRSST